MPPKPRSEDKRAKFWRELGLLPGAPECVIKAAHRYLIEIHHPDRGGSEKKAKAVNVARDEVLGEGAAANEYVAQNYTGEPWHVLGLMANAERALVDRAGKALAAELDSNRRLAERIDWAMKNWGRPNHSAAPTASPRPTAPASTVDFGIVEWKAPTTKIVDVELSTSSVPTVTPSNALRARIVGRSRVLRVEVSIDWDARVFRATPKQAYSLSGNIYVQERGRTLAAIRVMGTVVASKDVSITPRRAPKPRAPAAPGLPEGLVDRIDFGTLPWRSDAKHELRLTWREFAPYRIRVETPSPLIAEIIESKVLPGRFIIALTVDWAAIERERSPSVRGYTLDVPLTVRWPGDGEATVRVRGVLHSPATVFASPNELDLGAAMLDQKKTATFALLSNAATSVTVEPSAWLTRTDNTGRAIDDPIGLTANMPYRVTLAVNWAPIRERGATSIAAGTPVRPTGKIVVRWGDAELEVPVQMVVKTR